MAACPSCSLFLRLQLHVCMPGSILSLHLAISARATRIPSLRLAVSARSVFSWNTTLRHPSAGFLSY